MTHWKRTIPAAMVGFGLALTPVVANAVPPTNPPKNSTKDAYDTYHTFSWVLLNIANEMVGGKTVIGPDPTQPKKPDPPVKPKPKPKPPATNGGGGGGGGGSSDRVPSPVKGVNPNGPSRTTNVDVGPPITVRTSAK